MKEKTIAELLVELEENLGTKTPDKQKNIF